MHQARGHFDQMENEDGALRLRGWMLVPDLPLEEFRIVVDGREAGRCAPWPRDDVRDAYPAIPHARDVGFDFLLPDLPRAGSLAIDAYVSGAHCAQLRSRYRTDLEEIVPAPPEPLLARTIASGNAAYYRTEGLRAYGQFMDAVARHRDPLRVESMLDWGCGSGRNTVHFLRDPDVARVVGCDIDREAVEWCRAHLPDGRFEIAPTEPPLPFDDGSFDLVVGCSVFTHLDEVRQRAWLAELRRVLQPGGLLLATVHGDFAIDFHLRGLGPLRRGLARLRWTLRGFVDLGEDPRIEGAAPPGYYRAVFQSPRHTRRAWRDGFDIVEYTPAGLQAYQDLVVLRRRD